MSWDGHILILSHGERGLCEIHISRRAFFSFKPDPRESEELKQLCRDCWSYFREHPAVSNLTAEGPDGRKFQVEHRSAGIPSIWISA